MRTTRFPLPIAILASACLFSGAVQATPVVTVATNDATTISFTIKYELASAIERDVFLDIDDNLATGWRLGSGVAKIGADYKLYEGKLQRYTGDPTASPLQYTWTDVGLVSYVLDATNKTAQWVFPRSMIPELQQRLKHIAYVRAADNSNEQTAAALLQIETVTPTLARDPLTQPFASNSIWNRPIGTGAQYVYAQLPSNPGTDEWSSAPYLDEDVIILRPTAPATPILYSSAGWNKQDRCPATVNSLGATTTLTTVPIPVDFVINTPAASTPNSSAAYLMADGRTVIQSQPLARCTAGGVATSIVAFEPVDLYGPGITGAHGGAKMSALGGSIRIGELRPGSQGPRHALKLVIDSRQFLFKCGTLATCFRWPASGADNGAVGTYGSIKGDAPFAMRMGALLAIPTSVNIADLGLLSEPGRQLAWTLQNYGMYIVDSVGSGGYALNTETGPDGNFADQFYSDWQMKMDVRILAQYNNDWGRDFQKLMTYLSVVDNNENVDGPAGGGTPLQPLLPELPK